MLFHRRQKLSGNTCMIYIKIGLIDCKNIKIMLKNVNYIREKFIKDTKSSFLGLIFGRINHEENSLDYGWKRFFSYAWASGILQRIQETNEDVNLYIFNSSSEWSMDEDYNIGEYNIYNLPDFKEFDGIVVDLNNIRKEEIRNQVITAVRKSKKPAVSINNDVEGFYYVGINNYVAMQEIIQHLYEEHHCRKFWFVMGTTDNYENNIRYRSLKEFLEQHEIDYREEDFYFQHLIDDENFHVYGYPKQMNVEFAYEGGKDRSYKGQKIDSLFPFFGCEKKGMDFLFMPLHFRKRTIGYFVIRNALYLMEKQYLFKVVNILTSAMENLYEKEKELPFYLSSSIGCMITDRNQDKELEDYIREADKVMYKEKHRKKVNRTE